MRPKALVLSALLALSGCGGASPRPAATVSTAPAEGDVAAAGVRTPALAELLRESWERSLREDPVRATMIGDHRFDALLPDLSLEAQARHRDHVRSELERARALEGAIDPADRVTLRLFLDILDTDAANDVCEDELWNSSAFRNPISALSRLAQIHTIRSAEDARTYEARLRAAPAMLDQDLANLRAGVERGLVAPRASLERLVTLARRAAAVPSEEWPMVAGALGPLAAPGAAPSGVDADALRATLVAIVDAELRPAFVRYADGLEQDVVPHGRDAEHEGLWAMPNGAACYRARIRWFTTQPRTAEELHRIGTEEIARTDARMLELGAERFGVSRVAEVTQRLRTDASLGYETSDAIVADAEARIREAEALVPRFFSRAPTTPCAVVRIPEAEAASAPFAFYIPGAPDGSRPGAFFVNAAMPETRRRHQAAALVAHEAVPGHHYQITIAQSLDEMPAFRRFGLFSVYAEGWGLYAERLADEMGLYHDDLDRLGANDLDAFRAARLVVDTGLHAMRWSRAQAEQYMVEHTSLPAELIANDVDRYFGMPGQALAYKAGQIEMLALRDEARAALGDRFDLRAFHDVVLEVGPVTLPVLREVVTEWARASGERAHM